MLKKGQGPAAGVSRDGGRTSKLCPLFWKHPPAISSESSQIRLLENL